MRFSNEQLSDMLAQLKSAPRAEAKSVRAAIMRMRGDLITAMVEKHWTVAQLRDWLATQGIEVSLATLKTYLPGVRAARKAAMEKTAARMPRANQSASAAPERVVPPMPTFAWKKSVESTGSGDAPAEKIMRSTSFPVRPDTKDI